MMKKEFQRRRDYIYEAIRNIPEFSCKKPDGAFDLFPSVKETGLNGWQMAEILLKKAEVATVAGPPSKSNDIAMA